MKNLKNLTFLLLVGMLTIMSCGEDPVKEPTAEEAQLTLLVKKWNNNTVTLDGSTDQGDWSTFTVTFADGSYTSTGVSDGRELVWPSSGTWAFKGAGTDAVDVNTLVRGDGVEIKVTVDEANLTMSFTYDESINGRTTGIDGAWVFGMTN